MSDKNFELQYLTEFLEVPGVLKRLRELSEKYDFIIQPSLRARLLPRGEIFSLMMEVMVQDRKYISSIDFPYWSSECPEEEREEFIDRCFYNFESCLQQWSSPDFKPYIVPER